MTDYHHTIQSPAGEEIAVTVRRDKRLKKSSRWQREKDGSILLRVPVRLPMRHFPGLLESIAKQLGKPRKRAARRTDADLQARAEYLNRTCFNNQIEWQAIRWVGNMQQRLGSCTNGGPTDGHIRISDKMRAWPQWVVDYVIAHELAHRVHPNHSRAFWQYLQTGYPKTEQARGFIKGVGFAEGHDFEEG
ncbi:MAG: M48 family metallopeptidase [Anaerolineae bacterium]|nr:M48 family metallopeptidase [Anaerolineae bacterium]